MRKPLGASELENGHDSPELAPPPAGQHGDLNQPRKGADLLEGGAFP